MPGASVSVGGVTTPHGYRASGSSAGIKANNGLDLALLVSDTPATAAAVFTTNRAQAAPILVSREHLSASGGVARAIVVNSGCANACTGDEGLRAARDMAAETARLVECSVAEVLVASTGVIGVALPIEKIRAALPAAFRGLANDQGSMAARAIMTTDPFPKEAGGRSPDRRPHGQDRRHGQRLRHDRADDGHDARLHYDGCRRPAAAARPRACARRWTTPSTRSPSTANARPTIPSCCSPTAQAAHRSTSATTTRSWTGCMRCAASWRWASCAAAKARRSW